jgi:hypothetical protein
MIRCLSRSTAESTARNATESVDPVSRPGILEITDRKTYCADHLPSLPSDILGPSGRYPELIQNGWADSCFLGISAHLKGLAITRGFFFGRTRKQAMERQSKGQEEHSQYLTN